MKSSVKRRLQIRFVLLALAALVILQGLIVAFSIFRNYQQITGKADYIIRLTSTATTSSAKMTEFTWCFCRAQHRWRRFIPIPKR